MSPPLPRAALQALSRRFPTTDAVLAEIGALCAVLSLPKGTVHVVSDVHGEHKKLKHILANASGSLRPLVEEVVGASLSPEALAELLALLYYPRETWALRRPADPKARAAFLLRTVTHEVAIVRALGRRYARRHVERVLPPDLAPLLRELLEPDADIGALIAPFLTHGREIALLRALAHVVRNLSVFELIVAGDLGDRGPRIDGVLDLLMRQPSVTVVWGNHDASWLGAALGHEALVATVCRLSLRYGRLSQLEEGYGIPLQPIEQLAASAYALDPAERFAPKGGDGDREALTLARMHKAVAVIQFKLEGQLIGRHPEWDLEHRRLLHRMDLDAGTVSIDGRVHPLLDRHFPTVDPKDPYALSADEQRCVGELQRAFLSSPTLWNHMAWLADRGTMLTRRDQAIIFHACVPVEADRQLQSLVVDGEDRRGLALFQSLERVVRRAVRDRAPADLDWLWYLWTGPRSPLFGKDRMATFESHFVADKAASHEEKNAYFRLIHDADFCSRICAELGGDPARGLLINGHVPVRLEQGESPVKASRRAITIDGAFSEAYGDKGYTLILSAAATRLAQHHHFESVDGAVRGGADIIPTVFDVAVYDPPRRVADTEKGAEILEEIAVLEALIGAYEDHSLLETAAR